MADFTGFRKFDIGVFVLITSALPLRAYVWEKDIVMPFCTEEYYPFDSERLEKYVVCTSDVNMYYSEASKRLVLSTIFTNTFSGCPNMVMSYAAADIFDNF